MLPIDVTGPVTSAAVVMHPQGSRAPIITTDRVKCICRPPRRRSVMRITCNAASDYRMPCDPPCGARKRRPATWRAQVRNQRWLALRLDFTNFAPQT
jgi:hypothetical protein